MTYPMCPAADWLRILPPDRPRLRAADVDCGLSCSEAQGMAVHRRSQDWRWGGDGFDVHGDGQIFLCGHSDRRFLLSHYPLLLLSSLLTDSLLLVFP
jgi:hypothetical protein